MIIQSDDRQTEDSLERERGSELICESCHPKFQIPGLHPDDFHGLLHGSQATPSNGIWLSTLRTTTTATHHPRATDNNRKIEVGETTGRYLRPPSIFHEQRTRAVNQKSNYTTTFRRQARLNDHRRRSPNSRVTEVIYPSLFYA
jgi:hypothetical protein